MKHTTKKLRKQRSIFSRDFWDNPKLHYHFDFIDWKKYNKKRNKKVTINKYKKLKWELETY